MYAQFTASPCPLCSDNTRLLVSTHADNEAKVSLAYFKDTIKFCREHHVPFRLEPPGHERLLPRQLSVRDVDKCLVGQDDRDVRFEAERLGLPLLHRARLLQVDDPPRLLSSLILHTELEDAVVLRDANQPTRGFEQNAFQKEAQLEWSDGVPSSAALPSHPHCTLQRPQRAQQGCQMSVGKPKRMGSEIDEANGTKNQLAL